MASIQCANFSLSSRAQGSSLHLARPKSPIPWCSGAAWLRCRTGIRDPRALSSALDHTILGWGGSNPVHLHWFTFTAEVWAESRR